MRLVEHYPELLRDIYDKIEDAIGETVGAHAPFIAWETSEWIRAHWSGYYLTRTWWGHCAPATADPETGTLPEVQPQADQLRTTRGRELRISVLAILLQKVQHPRPCHLATDIAALVEDEWADKKIYVPIAGGVDRAIRDQQVWQDFGGGMADIERVVAKHGLSQDAIYKAFRRVQQARKEREEPLLPGF